MDPSSPIRYTRFPDLRNDNTTDHPPPYVDAHSRSTFHLWHCSRTVLTESWARLLCAYTGEIAPVFQLGGQPVTFHTGQKKLNTVRFKDIQQVQQGFTELDFSRVRPK